ncbi:protein of unknown function [Methylacidimicrobium sp. AP8]|nr:protein of unknown function [Methylacidimicrobium sp. AP8]CAB4243930.1 protein of unknown function [Methylacidimicrobium sp. AP8]
MREAGARRNFEPLRTEPRLNRQKLPTNRFPPLDDSRKDGAAQNRAVLFSLESLRTAGFVPVALPPLPR